jgi:hypothetical protein
MEFDVSFCSFLYENFCVVRSKGRVSTEQDVSDYAKQKVVINFEGEKPERYLPNCPDIDRLSMTLLFQHFGSNIAGAPSYRIQLLIGSV